MRSALSARKLVGSVTISAVATTRLGGGAAGRGTRWGMRRRSACAVVGSAPAQAPAHERRECILRSPGVPPVHRNMPVEVIVLSSDSEDEAPPPVQNDGAYRRRALRPPRALTEEAPLVFTRHRSPDAGHASGRRRFAGGRKRACWMFAGSWEEDGVGREVLGIMDITSLHHGRRVRMELLLESDGRR